MEKVKEFLKLNDGNGDGYGNGYGNGNGDGDGDGNGYGNGDGNGDGYGNGIKVFNGQNVYRIDGVPTILKNIHNNAAKGYILNNDMTLKPCFVVKSNNYFAHGETLKKAIQALEEKTFDDMDTDERINLFLNKFNTVDKYPIMQFYEWHHKLTGSCEMGRKDFAARNNLDLERDELTVNEFIDLTINAYGGSVMQKLKERLCGSWQDSRGCNMEYGFAKAKGMPIKFITG